MKIAYFTPLSDTDPIFRDYSINLIHNLTNYADIAVIVEDFKEKHLFGDDFSIYSFKDFESLSRAIEFDLMLYDMADQSDFFYIYPFIRRFPGVVVLHDYSCHPVRVEGGVDVFQSVESCDMQDGGTKQSRPSTMIPLRYIHDIWTELDDFLYPKIVDIADSCLACIVYDDRIMHKIASACPDLDIRHIAYATDVQNSTPEKRNLKEEMGIKAYDPIFGVFPNKNKTEQLNMTLRTFKSLIQRHPNALLVIVAELQDGDWYGTIDFDDIWENILIVNPTGHSLFDCMSLIDIAFAFNHPMSNGVSLDILKLMAYSKPVVIFNGVLLNVLPDNVCIKIEFPYGDMFTENIIDRLTPLIVDRKARAMMAGNAKSYILTHHRYDKVAREFCEFFDRAVKCEMYNIEMDRIFSVVETIGIRGDKTILQDLTTAKYDLHP